MFEKKYKIVDGCLVICVLVQLVALVQAGIAVAQAIGIVQSNSLVSLTAWQLLYPMAFAVCFVGAYAYGAYKVSRGLRAGKSFYWILGVALLVLGVFSWALPFALLGLICLFDKRIRQPFLEKLDIQF